MQIKKLEKIIVAFIFILIPVLLFKDGFQHGKILYGQDTIQLDFPFRLFAQRMFQQYHDLPLWMPYILGGIPLIDSSNLIYFYPTNLLYMLLPVPLYYTYTIDIIIHMLIAAFGMYLLLKQFELKKAASLFGGFVFMTGAFLISLVYAGHSGNTKAVALMPYIFYFISRGIKEGKFFHFLNASIFCALCVLCLGMQIMAYAYIGVFLYILYEIFFSTKERNLKKAKKTTIFFILSTGMIVLLSAVQFFQSTTYLPYSFRGNFTYENFVLWSFNPKEAITFLFPNFFGLKDPTYWGPMENNMTTFYMGIIPFMLVPFAFILGKFRKFAIFSTIIAVIFFILGCGRFTPVYNIFFYFPVFNKFRVPLRFIYIFDLFIIILSAVGMNNIILAVQEQNYNANFKKNILFKIWLWLTIMAGIILFIMLSIASNTDFLYAFIKQTSSFTNTFTNKPSPSDDFISSRIKEIMPDVIYFGAIAFSFLIIIYLQLRKKINQTYVFLGLIAVLSFIDLYRVDSQFIRFDDISDHFEENNPIIQRLQQDKGIFRSTDMNFNLPANKNIYYGLEFMSGYHGLAPFKYYTISNRPFNTLNIPRIFNIKYYLSQNDINVDGLKKIFDGPIKIIEDTKTLPRALFLDKVVKLDSDDQILSLLSSERFDLASVATTDNIFIDWSPEKLQYDLQITEYTPNRIKINLNSNKAGVLVLSNNYYPSWRAKIDGKPEKIYNVDYAIMGIPVDKGIHEIEFYYSRMKILMSLLLTILGILIYVSVYFFETNKKQKSI